MQQSRVLVKILNFLPSNILLNGGHLELGFTRHANDTAHDTAVSNGEDNASAITLNHKCRRKSQVSRFKCILSGGIDGAWDWVTEAKFHKRPRGNKVIVVTFHQSEENDRI